MRIKPILLGAIGAATLAWASTAPALIVSNANINTSQLDGSGAAGSNIEFHTIDPVAPVPPGYTGPITAAFSHKFNFSADENVTDTFTDTYKFLVLVDGQGDGSASASRVSLLQSIFFDTTPGTVTFDNGVDTPTNITISPDGKTASLDNLVTIYANTVATITISGTTHGGGFYNGNVAFAPTDVPEAATWAMMMIGFGGIGSSMRYRRRKTAAAQLNPPTITYA